MTNFLQKSAIILALLTCASAAQADCSGPLVGFTVAPEEIGLPTDIARGKRDPCGGQPRVSAILSDYGRNSPGRCRSSADPLSDRPSGRVERQGRPAGQPRSERHRRDQGTTGAQTASISADRTLKPLARGFATFGSNSGHQDTAFNGSFATNEEARRNYTGEAIKKLRDVADQIMSTAYDRP